MARRPRIFSELDKRELLDSLRSARHQCTRSLAAAPIYGDEYRAILKLMASLDELAEALTGDREHLWPRTANTTWPSRMPDRNDKT